MQTGSTCWQPQWAELRNMAAMRRYEAAVRAALEEDQARQVLEDPAAPWLWRTLREAEAAGINGPAVLHRAVTSGRLDDAESVAKVLDWRIRQHTAGLPAVAARPWAELAVRHGRPGHRPVLGRTGPGDGRPAAAAGRARRRALSAVGAGPRPGARAPGGTGRVGAQGRAGRRLPGDVGPRPPARADRRPGRAGMRTRSSTRCGRPPPKPSAASPATWPSTPTGSCTPGGTHSPAKWNGRRSTRATSWPWSAARSAAPRSTPTGPAATPRPPTPPTPGSGCKHSPPSTPPGNTPSGTWPDGSARPRPDTTPGKPPPPPPGTAPWPPTPNCAAATPTSASNPSAATPHPNQPPPRQQPSPGSPARPSPSRSPTPKSPPHQHGPGSTRHRTWPRRPRGGPSKRRVSTPTGGPAPKPRPARARSPTPKSPSTAPDSKDQDHVPSQNPARQSRT